ncbi:MAG: tripartite tricarboxylate transporter TctB family protein [Candidatus Rokubacteria bacterium]|nr:tripartite tricarboxylate transporter TctB family protein [Candidatus Rokubacteria bacterium]
MSRVELAVDAFWVLLGAAIIAHAVQLRLWEPSGPGSGFVPLLAGAVIAAGGLGLLLARPRPARAEVFWAARASALRIVAVLAGLVTMAVLMPVLGFLLTAAPTMAFLLTVIERQRWTWVVGMALASSVGLYWLFDRVLEMALPKGPLGF